MTIESRLETMITNQERIIDLLGELNSKLIFEEYPTAEPEVPAPAAPAPEAPAPAAPAPEAPAPDAPAPAAPAPDAPAPEAPAPDAPAPEAPAPDAPAPAAPAPAAPAPAAPAPAAPAPAAPAPAAPAPAAPAPAEEPMTAERLSEVCQAAAKKLGSSGPGVVWKILEDLGAASIASLPESKYQEAADLVNKAVLAKETDNA